LNQINSDEETSTVTVVTAIGTTHQWEAAGIEIDEGALLIGAGEKDGLAEVFAVYAPGQWQHAGLDEHRAEDGTDHAARVAELEAALREAREIASGCGTDGGTPFTAICDLADRVLGDE
jgi:hypothetical protein